jgi:hypothetical protein
MAVGSRRNWSGRAIPARWPDEPASGDRLGVATFEWHLPHVPPMAPPIRVRIRCEYPGTPLDPMVLSFVADASLGRTPTEVDAEITRLRTTLEAFELRAAGDPIPLPFRTETIRSIAVW